MSNTTELMRRAADALRSELGPVPPYYIYGLIQELEEHFLAAEKEAEPYTQSLYPELTPRAEQKFGYAIQLNDGSWVVEFSNDEANGAQEVGRTVIPLYTRPEPARKPMTEDAVGEEILRNADEWSRNFANGFVLGIRFAEKHHGIGSNKSDPDSIDLQSRCRGDKL